ncbi:UNVERIFIED_CONTAM: hypothetical protein Slati_0441600 [Sesamum latifolium]|uniref:Retrotransposon gag protein n=1 Tax=Sesamum latifolium TaxID=2727402 RepID=A0AAW2XYB7_9LAMI
MRLVEVLCMTPTEARKLITTLAANSQQFGTRNDNPPRKVNEPPPPPQSNPNSGHSNMHSKFGKSHSHKYSELGEPNPCEHSKFGVSSEPISLLRQSFGIPSERELQFENSNRRGHAQQNRTKNSVVRGYAKQGKIGEELKNSPKQAENYNQVDEEHPKVFVPKPPFPKRFAKFKKEEEEKDILETLRKVEVNIPLLNAIKQVPRYAKFLKEMCINKSKLRTNERVSMGKNVSTILQSKLPPKCKDPGNAMFDDGGAFKMTINKNLTSSPRTYKNKVFHEKISSRKKSSMNRQVLINPHHHRVHYIDEVDSGRPTHLS